MKRGSGVYGSVEALRGGSPSGSLYAPGADAPVADADSLCIGRIFSSAIKGSLFSGHPRFAYLTPDFSEF
jgi:hypothetical protein